MATASRHSMINRMRKSSYGSGAKPAKPASTAFYEELFNKFKDSEERRCRVLDLRSAQHGLTLARTRDSSTLTLTLTPTLTLTRTATA